MDNYWLRLKELKEEWEKVQEVRAARVRCLPHVSFKYEINSFEAYVAKNMERRWSYILLNWRSGQLMCMAKGVTFTETIEEEQ